MFILRLIVLAYALLVTDLGMSYTANKVWLELRSTGRFRVWVNYTVPELKEMKEVWVEFAKKQEADAYYFDLLRGADFYIPHASARTFQNQGKTPDPW